MQENAIGPDEGDRSPHSPAVLAAVAALATAVTAMPVGPELDRLVRRHTEPLKTEGLTPERGIALVKLELGDRRWVPATEVSRKVLARVVTLMIEQFYGDRGDLA